MRRARAALLAAGLVVGACNSLSGAGDLEVGVNAPAASDAGAPGDADAGATTDSGASSLPSCGVARVCVFGGAGWTPALSARSFAASCPASYPTALDLYSVTTMGDGCTCNCGGPNPSPCPPKVRVGYGNATCTLGTLDIPFPPDGGCVSDPSLPLTFAKFTFAPYDGGTTWSCTASAEKSVGAATAARICSGATGTGDGCAADQVCVPQAASGTNCVMHDGDVSCPDAFPRKTLVGPTTQDTRACSSCACGADPSCSDGTLTSFVSTDCKLVGTPVAAGTCALPPSTNFRIQLGTGCKVTTPSQLTGSLTATSPRTLCCSG